MKLKPFVPEKYITSPEAEAQLLNDALQSGHAGHIANVLGVIARARSMTELADKTGISRSTLYATLSEGGNPTLDTLMKTMEALGFSLAAFPVAEETESNRPAEPPVGPKTAAGAAAS
jgi:probable addiction module antidote protein